MPSSRSLWVILLLALTLRISAAAYWQHQAQQSGVLFRLGDSDGYWVLAAHIARGEPYQYGTPDASVFRAPLFPLVLAPLTWISDPRTAVWWARVLGSVLGTVAVYELMLLAARLGRPVPENSETKSPRGAMPALIAGVVGAVSPAAVGMSVVVLSEMLLVPLMLAQLLLWQSAWRSQEKRKIMQLSIAAGLVAGAAVLARPSWLLFTPFLMLLGCLAGPQRWKHLHIGLVSMLGICLIMSPWWARNAMVTGKFVPTTLQVGPSLYDGLHPGASGASDEGMAFMLDIVAAQRSEDRLATGPLESTLEYRVNQRAQLLATEWARNHPSAVLQLAVAKFVRTWSFWPDGGELGSTAIRLVVTVATFGVCLLATYGTMLAIGKHGWLVTVCWVPCIYFTLLHMVFVGSIRYREPAVFVLTALAGCAIAHWVSSRGFSKRCVTKVHGRASEPSNPRTL